MRTFLTLATALALAACSGDKKEETETQAADSEAAGGEAATGTPSGVALPKGTKKEQQPGPDSVDHADPAAVVATLFAAAKSNNSMILSGLCDPKGENDGDTKDICSLTTKSPKWSEFVEYFQDGSVAGEPSIDGETASVPIKFGPGGARDETVKLVKRDNGWYLSSF